MSYVVGVIRVITITSEKLLRRHGEIIEKHYQVLRPSTNVLVINLEGYIMKNLRE